MKAMTSAALTLLLPSEFFLCLATGPDFPWPLIVGTRHVGLRRPGTPARLRREAQRLRQLIDRPGCIAMGFGQPRRPFAISQALRAQLAQLLLKLLRNHNLRA